MFSQIATSKRLDEELVNAATHAFGLGLVTIGAGWVVGVSVAQGSLWHIIGCGVYGLTLIVLYAASTAYHSVLTEPRKEFFRLVDQVGIYLLIAGTYTPFALMEGGPWGWTILALVWVFASLGIVLRFLDSKWLDTTLYAPYIAIGSLFLIAAKPICERFPSEVTLWIIVGGLAYLGGVYFVVKDRRYFHAIWHLFVLTGSACHYWAVVRFLESTTA